MHKHSIRLAFSLLLSSVVLFLTLAAVQPPRRSWQDFPSSPQPEICARLSAEPHQLGLTTAATTTVLGDPDPSITQTEWYDTCDIHRMEITGMGMGNKTTAINPQTVALTDPVKVSWLWVQVAGRYSNTTHTPESVTFTTDTPESLILNQPASNTSEGYTFETELQPAGQITAFVYNPGDTFKTPRGLVLYAKREVEDRWTSIGKTMNSYIYHNTHTEVLTFPPLIGATDLYITAVVINNQADSNSLILEARAGEGLTQTVPIAGPADGSLLNIIPLTLTNVPANTDQVTLTLHSPTDNDDSPVWVGANVSYRCGADLAVTKTVNDPTPDAEEIITYTVTVVNNGPEDATGVQVRDKLPEGITFITYTATAGTVYSSTTGIWDVGNLLNGASAVLTITARVNSCTNGRTIPNATKILTPGQPDPNLGNNEAGMDITVTSVISCYIYLPIILKTPPCHTETFNNNTPDVDWHIPPPPPGTIRQYINEEYQIFSQTKQGVHWSRSPMGDFTDYIIEVEAHWGNNEYVGMEYGLIFDRSGKNDKTAKMYRFNINTTDKTYVLGRLLNDKWEYDGLPSGFSPDIKNDDPTKDINVLKVIRQGDIVELYINGKYQSSYDDDNKLNNRPARVGVNVVPIKNIRDGDARFDNLKICSYELNYNNPVSTNEAKTSSSGGIAPVP